MNSTNPLSLIETDQVRSVISPWLVSIVYPLKGKFVLPFYFSEIKVTGYEKVPSTGPVIIAPTHRSRWDSLIIPYSVGRDKTGRHLRFMVTENEMGGFQGIFMKRLGCFPMNVDQPSLSSFRHSLEILHRQQTLVIFPEGNIFRDYQLHPLKLGLARLALQAEKHKVELGVNIIPISLYYSDPYAKWGTKIRVRVGDPIVVADYMNIPTKPAAEKITQDLEIAIKQLDQENGVN